MPTTYYGENSGVGLALDNLPEGTRPLGYVDFHVQDLKFEAHNTRYRRAR